MERISIARRLPRRVRRVIVVVTMLGLPGSYAWYAIWSGTSVPKSLWGPFSFVLILVSVVGALVLYGYAGYRATRGNRGLDERERQLRDQAWIVSYVVLSIAVVSGVTVASIVVLGFDRNITLDGRVMGGVVTCFAVLVPLLPYAALSWLEPNPPPED